MAKKVDTWTFKNASPREQIMYMAGISPNYWKYSHKHVEFTDITKQSYQTRKSITSKAQEKQWTNLLHTVNDSLSRTVCIASGPTDHQAMVTAVALAKVKLGGLEGDPMAYKAIRFVNSMIPPYRSTADIAAASMLVIYNIMEDAPSDRLQYIRDYLTLSNKGRTPLRVLVVGAGSPLDFMWDRLRFQADLYFWNIKNIGQKIVI